MINGTKNNKTKFFRILHSKLIDWFLYEGSTGIQWVNKETEKKTLSFFMVTIALFLDSDSFYNCILRFSSELSD